jgi:hypothetical protein
VDGEPAASYPGFMDELRACCAKVLALSGDAVLVFVGRSPESLFDYLSGILAQSSWSERCVLLNLSLWQGPGDRHQRVTPAARQALQAQLRELGLDPTSILRSPSPVVLIDVIASGGSLGRLVQLLTAPSQGGLSDAEAVRRRLRIVGITERKKNSPNTWRWHQQVSWAAQFRPSVLKSVSVPWHLWNYLGNIQEKVARTNPPWRWGDAEMLRPPREARHAAALRLALAVYERGLHGPERLGFASELARQPAMRSRWLRQLVLEIRRAAA